MVKLKREMNLLNLINSFRTEGDSRNISTMKQLLFSYLDRILRK